LLATLHRRADGRGRAQGSIAALRSRSAGRRRVIVKTRVVRLKGADLSAAWAHLRYVQRDGVTREGQPGELYDAASDEADGKAFLERSGGDRHQFRFIVSPEDGAELGDLKPRPRPDAADGARSRNQARLRGSTGSPADHLNTAPVKSVMETNRSVVSEVARIAIDALGVGGLRASDLRQNPCDVGRRPERLGAAEKAGRSFAVARRQEI
jgi:hypothetical protein